jgi:hypothetical protein
LAPIMTGLIFWISEIASEMSFLISDFRVY